MDAAACIGCGACVAVCKTPARCCSSRRRFSHLNYLPQGQAEKDRRVKHMVAQMDKEGFGNCTVTGRAKPSAQRKSTSTSSPKMNRDYAVALVKGELKGSGGGGVG